MDERRQNARVLGLPSVPDGRLACIDGQSVRGAGGNLVRRILEVHEVADQREDVVRELCVEGDPGPPVRLLVDTGHNIRIPFHHLEELRAPTFGEPDKEHTWYANEGFRYFSFVFILVLHHEQLAHYVRCFIVCK